jgi:hypothetical protein
LNAGVDSSIANAEVSNARQGIIDAKNLEIQANAQLAQFLINLQAFDLDSLYFISIPKSLETLNLSSKIQPFNGMLQELL